MDPIQILIIDDEETVRSVIKRTLRNEGYDLLFAENGARGLELLEQNHPTVIVLDLQMPRVNGISFLEKIKIKPDDPFGVIILTGHGSDEDMQTCYDLGAHLFLRKPFGYTEFLCQVHRLISLKQLEAQVRSEALIAKENFSNNINHELRTPLHVINTSLSLIGRNSIPENKRKFFDFIVNSSEDLLQLINKILDYNLLKQERGTIKSESFNLLELIEKITKDHEPSALKKGLTITFVSSNNLPEVVQSDSDRIQKIISYLMENAIKFTESGRVDLQINLHSETEKQLMILFTLNDTGIGMNKKTQEIIYEQFKQGNEEITREKGGIGIGLTLVGHLVRSLQGSISLSSSPGKGSSFNILIPCNIPNADEPQ